MSQHTNSDGLDIAGFGKIVKAIPAKVYERSAAVLLTTFQELTAPITETTSGLGRYLRQKFDNMVAAEKAIATYTLEKAIARAKARAARQGQSIRPPAHPKSFVNAIEEAAQETEPLLHEMWTNLLASQLVDDDSHPHFVNLLPHFSPSEATLLLSLLPISEVGQNEGGVLVFGYDSLSDWIRKAGADLNPWTLSCVFLCEFHLADLLAPKDDARRTQILFRTAAGSAFLRAVSPPVVDWTTDGS